MKVKALIILGLFSSLLLIAALATNTMAQEEIEEGHTIHPFANGTTTSYTTPSGIREGCLTACEDHDFLIDFYYCDTSDNDQRITSLTLQAGDGSDENSYGNVIFPHTYFYTYDGTNWIPYSGTGDIDVPWSGKNAPGQLKGDEPHVVVLVRFHITGELGDVFYYRVHFESAYYTASGSSKPGNAGNHYFWYEICEVPPPPQEVPEFQLELPVITMLGTVAAYMVRRRKFVKCQY